MVLCSRFSIRQCKYIPIDVTLYQFKYQREIMPKTRQDVEREIENANREGRAINLRGWNLAKVDLSHLNLSGADCRGADLNHAILQYANLEGAKIGLLPTWVPSLRRGAIAGSSLLLACKAVGTHWGDAVLIGPLAGALVASSKSSYRTNLRVTDLTRANLKSADLTGAEMIGAILLGTDLSNATVSKLDLTAAILVNIKLEGTGLSLDDLPDAIVSTASINNPEQLVKSVDLLATMHLLEKGRADTDATCPISHMPGNEIEDAVYVRKTDALELRIAMIKAL